MKKLNLHKYLIIVAGLLVFASCHRVVLKVDDLPSNTPLEPFIFVTGNFNNWDPGEEKYQLRRGPDSAFYVSLPPGFGTIEFKFTRGDWTTVEKDICGYEIDNRYIQLGDNDTIVQSIAAWGDLDPVDCPRLTLVLSEIPSNTPEEDNIVVAGDFNRWEPDSEWALEKDSTGKYSITIPRPQNKDVLEFKITRGEMSKAESDEFGDDIPTRKIKFGQKDTLELEVKGWVDKPEKNQDRVVFIIENLPANSPGFDDVFLVSNMNNWNPGDRNYVFQRNKNWQLFLSLPRKSEMFEFKVTRGNWFTVEVDKYGYDIPNRVTNLFLEDTVRLNVMAWKDLTRQSDESVTVLLRSIPENTPEDAKMYIAGSFNNWNMSRLKYRFQQNEKGQYYVNIPRDKHSFRFLISRGSWNSIELDQYGSAVLYREHEYYNTDTVFVDVENWMDIPKYKPDGITIVIDELPSSTPSQDNLFIAADFQGWNPEAASWVFQYLDDGRPYITIQKDIDRMEYKITRGGWDRVEVDNMGQEIPNRVLILGFADTAYVKVMKWRDFDGSY